MIFLHRYLLENQINNYDVKMDIDHINHDKLYNRKKNLRIVNRSQNNMNRTPKKEYKTNGIYYSTDCNKYIARITLYNEVIQLGAYRELEDAIKARKEAEEKYFGEYSYDNSMKMEEFRIESNC